MGAPRVGVTRGCLYLDAQATRSIDKNLTHETKTPTRNPDAWGTLASYNAQCFATVASSREITKVIPSDSE
jgi:hypothetical protein